MVQRLCVLLYLLLSTSMLWGQGGVASSDDLQSPVTTLEERYPDEDRASVWLLTPLSAYESPFEALSRYNFSFTRYVRRGYDWNSGRITLNGIDLNNPITGNPFWSILNAIQQAPFCREFTQTGITPSASTIGGVAGIREYQIDALQESLGSRVGWMFTDRRFRHGFRLGVTTGSLAGWALTAAATRRWGEDRHIQGVYADDWTLCLSLAKQLGKRHSLSGTFLLAPTEQGTRSAATTEAFALTGNPLYNPSWGYQQNRIRSSRVRTNQQPLAMVTWRYDPHTKWTMTTTLSYLWGHTSRSMLDWYDAQNPQPDYYRYLPDAYDNPLVSSAVRQAWQRNDPYTTQINWTELYRQNLNRDTLSAAYVLGSAVEQCRNFQLASHFNFRASDLLQLNGGVRIRMDKIAFFNRMDDLLGAPFLTDIDPYLVDDQFFGDKLQNDLRHPNRKITPGERYGYHYDMNYTSYEGWCVVDMRNRHNERFGGYIGLQAAQIGFSRDGKYEKELFPGNGSYGRSATLKFTDYTIKTGVSYLFTPKHYVKLDLFYGDVAPAADQVFIAPEYRNQVIDQPRPIHQFGSELCYRFTGGVWQVEVRGYFTSSRGESDVRHYYDDLASLFSDMVLTGINKRYAGIEIGTEFTLSQRFRLRLAAAESHNEYQNNPSVQILSNKDGSDVAGKTTSNLKGFRLGGSPQRVASVELHYQNTKLWMASVAVNYTAHSYVSVSPLNRMHRIYDYATSPENRQSLTAQECFPEAVTINLFLMKSFRIKSHYLSISGSINNLANKKNIVYSGYEQMRLRKSGTGLNQSVTTLGSKYLYAYPRTYYLSINFRF